MKVVAEEWYVDGGWHEDDPEVGAVLEEALDHAEQEVPVEVALVHLVQHDHVVARQGGVRGDLPEQEVIQVDMNIRMEWF